MLLVFCCNVTCGQDDSTFIHVRRQKNQCYLFARTNLMTITEKTSRTRVFASSHSTFHSVPGRTHRIFLSFSMEYDSYTQRYLLRKVKENIVWKPVSILGGIPTIWAGMSCLALPLTTSLLILKYFYTCVSVRRCDCDLIL